MFNGISVTETLTDILKQKEFIILGQINDLIKSGILVIEEGDWCLVRDEGSDRFLYKQSIKLVSKEAEVIEALRKENVELKNRLDTIKGALNV